MRLVSAPLEGEVLGPEALLTFDEFWKSIPGNKGLAGPAIAAWRALTDDDRRAIHARIGPLGLDTEGMWACVWLRERRWECEPLSASSPMIAALDRAMTEGWQPSPPKHHRTPLKPYSPEWIAERDRKRAAGESVAFMEEQARAGNPWGKWQ